MPTIKVMLSLWICAFMCCVLSTCAKAPKKDRQDEKPRIIVLTDYFKDPDDKQSLIRFLLYSNEFDIRGIIATSLAYGTGEVHPEWIKELLDSYAKVRANLLLHDPDYPSAEKLKALVSAGVNVKRKYVGPGKGFKTPFGEDLRSCAPAEDYIGEGKDTEGSEHIIRVVDESNSPTWILVWGGAMDLAQALWKVRETRNEQALEEFIKKIRHYQIHWQDTGATWLWREFPEVFRIQGLSSFDGMYKERGVTAGNKAWVRKNIINDHAVLGANYPIIDNIDGVKEGDSPSFLHLIANGLSDPEKPEQGNWGGRFKRFQSDKNIFIDDMDKHPTSDNEIHGAYWTVARWSDAVNRDFAARMDWCVRDYDNANHPPIVHLNNDTSDDVLYINAKSGDRIKLSADGSSDADNDQLRYKWINYRESGNYDHDIIFGDSEKKETYFTVPAATENTTVHIILSVTDDGTPGLTRYRRLVVSIN